MNSEKLNNWLSLLANLAVIVGIIVLVIEISQNTQAIRLSSYQDLTGRIVEINQFTMGNPAMNELNTKMGFNTPVCAREGNSSITLSEGEESLLNNLLFIWFRHADMAYFQYETGAISRERLMSAAAPLLNILDIPYVIDRWNLVKTSFVLEYREFVDEQAAEFNKRC